jgi:hypothetical protein
LRWQRIQALIVKADTVIFVLSPHAVSSSTCQKEVAFAASLNMRFAPIVCRPVDIAKVPSELSRLNFISFEDETRFENNADKLAEALSTDIELIQKHTEFGELAQRGTERWKRVHEERKYASPSRSRRFLVLQSGAPPRGRPQLGYLGHPEQQSRLPVREDAHP